MSKLTGGPWKLDRHPNPGFGFRIVAPCPSELDPSGEMFIAEGIQVEANAYAIGALPEMLACLTRIAAMPCTTALLGEDGDCACASCDAKGAIAKAGSRS